MLFMLTAIGVKIPEDIEFLEKVKNPAPARRDPMEKKKKKERAYKEYYDSLADSQTVKDDEEAEKYYEEEEARLNAESASKDYEDLADAETLKEDEEEARLLIAALVLFIGLKKLGL
ncbi:unnamed protein product [Brassica rapa subsp. trilocularis]